MYLYHVCSIQRPEEGVRVNDDCESLSVLGTKPSTLQEQVLLTAESGLQPMMWCLTRPENHWGLALKSFQMGLLLLCTHAWRAHGGKKKRLPNLGFLKVPAR